MDIQNTKKWVRYDLTQQWVGTLGITWLAFAIRWALQPVLQPYGVFHFFIVSSLLVQYLFGYRMALVAVALSLALGEIFFVAPYGEFSHLEDKDLIISLNFVLVIVPAIFLIEKLQRSLYGRELLGQVNASRMLVALRRENDRIFLGKKADLSTEWIDCVLTHFEQLLFLKTPHHPVMRGPAFHQLTGGQIAPDQAWTHCLAASDWAEISRPLDGPDWQAKRWERDFEIQLTLAQGKQTLKGKVIHFQAHDQRTELWVLGPH